MNTVKLQTLLTQGKTVGQIAKQLRVKKEVVQAHIDANSVKGNVVNTAYANKAFEAQEQAESNNKMAEMLAGAQQAKEVVTQRTKTTLRKVEASKSVDAEGNKVQKRNKNLATRKAAVFVCDSLKQAWVGAHIAFTTKTTEGMLQVVRNAPQKALTDMQNANDLRLAELSAEVELGNTLELEKQKLFDKYKELGYTMMSRRAKVAEATA